jgi:hypothetical protein
MTGKIIQVRIGKSLIGLRGLPEIFREVAAQTWKSPDATQEELLRRGGKRNNPSDRAGGVA